MTQEQMMKAIVEAAGECWHEWLIATYTTIYAKDPITTERQYLGCGYECTCGFKRLNRINWNIGNQEPKCIKQNPSPTDLNELFRLADKLDRHDIIFYQVLVEPCEVCEIDQDSNLHVYAQGNTPAEALLNALYKAVKGEQ